MIEAINNILPVIVKTLERVHDNSWKMDYNVHDSYELIFVKKGNIDFWVEEERIELKAGDLLIIKPYTRHKFEVISCSKAEFVVMGFYLKPESRAKVDELKEIYGFLNVLESISSRFYFFHVRKRSNIFFCLESILHEAKENKNDILLYIKCLELFIYITREINSLEMTKNYDYSLLARHIKEYIDNNYMEDIKMGDIAKRLFMSESTLSRIFKNHFGVLPKEYLLSKRIEKAKEYLSMSNLKISNIAMMCGFSSLQRFNDIFKKYTGLSPTQYRKLILQGLE
ncbi:transcriptional regulator, AraC family [Caldicellulosiruptor obsidiansis OB47]|uniref:Transcriptional regulator, AraC family n=1 Tax=Caldicellulosiruptor obsidiansis (strain ATCC BAA-2073 / JCM 16842 / OB47) TaxID=608506 RepID=D9TG68_CALOO|nr:AraC family transcriptional regulator [Caldicellulosiruptor obsidiansis]ADL43188.1 transcriptional regulator, AraC family [Caldicellulosiruptor obsidiansis OB47]